VLRPVPRPAPPGAACPLPRPAAERAPRPQQQPRLSQLRVLCPQILLRPPERQWVAAAEALAGAPLRLALP
jgi:hypothetical protein